MNCGGVCLAVEKIRMALHCYDSFVEFLTTGRAEMMPCKTVKESNIIDHHLNLNTINLVSILPPEK